MKSAFQSIFNRHFLCVQKHLRPIYLRCFCILKIYSKLLTYHSKDQVNFLLILSKRESELGCGEVGELLDMSKSAVSYHFKTLREAGLTITRKAGQNKFVRLNHETLEKYSLTNLINNL